MTNETVTRSECLSAALLSGDVYGQIRLNDNASAQLPGTVWYNQDVHMLYIMMQSALRKASAYAGLGAQVE